MLVCLRLTRLTHLQLILVAAWTWTLTFPLTGGVTERDIHANLRFDGASPS